MEAQPRPISWTKRLQYAGWAFPLLLATLHQVLGSTQRPMAEVPTMPGLSFEQYLIDYGSVGPTEEVRTHFAFVNMSDRLIEIDKLDPSCGCLQPRLDEKSKQLDPGERGEFLIRIQTANQAVGPKEYTVTVYYRDPEPRQTTVRFRVTLPDNQVAVRPRAVMMYLTGDTPMIQSAEVIDRRSRKFEIVKLECQPEELATVESLGETDDDEGHRHYKLRITVNPDFPDGAYRGTIWVHTNDPAYQTVRLPLAVQKGATQKKNRNKYDNVRRVEPASHQH
ncbi:MAG: DUF1573 domain-containing protein [Planctomycetota bacterium]|nr:DUF1573 domain-containing protein [Planctomycetota bacterium]